MRSGTDFLPELLSPAGSPEALAAAIEGGADAVYFGAEKFSARMRAKNFTDTELADAVALCRAYGVRTYITVNTRLRDAFVAILTEGHKAQTDLFEAARQQGWYQVEQAPRQKVEQALQKFTNQMPTLN